MSLIVPDNQAYFYTSNIGGATPKRAKRNYIASEGKHSCSYSLLTLTIDATSSALHPPCLYPGCCISGSAWPL